MRIDLENKRSILFFWNQFRFKITYILFLLFINQACFAGLDELSGVFWGVGAFGGDAAVSAKSPFSYANRSSGSLSAPGFSVSSDFDFSETHSKVGGIQGTARWSAVLKPFLLTFGYHIQYEAGLMRSRTLEFYYPNPNSVADYPDGYNLEVQMNSQLNHVLSMDLGLKVFKKTVLFSQLSAIQKVVSIKTKSSISNLASLTDNPILKDNNLTADFFGAGAGLGLRQFFFESSVIELQVGYEAFFTKRFEVTSWSSSGDEISAQHQYEVNLNRMVFGLNYLYHL